MKRIRTDWDPSRGSAIRATYSGVFKNPYYPLNPFKSVFYRILVLARKPQQSSPSARTHITTTTIAPISKKEMKTLINVTEEKKKPHQRSKNTMIPIAKPLIGDEEEHAVIEVLRSGMLTHGEQVKKFEKRFADFVGTKYALATVNGTIALYLALKACGICRGDEVITTPFTFMATASSIIFAGATPVFVDINPETFNIDPHKIEVAITEKTKAIMPVHLYGQSTEMDRINEIAQKHGLKVIEDACQAHGAMFNGKKAGSLGDAGCFSFYPTKNMTTGEGGMITTNNEEIVEHISILRNHGQKEVYDHVSLGFNYRMTNIAAAIGIEQLKKLDFFNKRRRQNAHYLSKYLGEHVETPKTFEQCFHVYHQYTVQTDARDTYMGALREGGVGTRIYYPKAIHQYEHMDYLKKHDLSHSERAARRVFSLPVHPEVKEEDLELMVDIIQKTAKTSN